MHYFFRTLAISAAIFISGASYAQGTVSLQAGLVQSVMKKTASSLGGGGEQEYFQNTVGFSVGLATTWHVTKRIQAGASLRYLQRRFQYIHISQESDNRYFDDLYKGRFIYIGAVGDMALDKKQILHIAITPAVGFLADGKENYYSGNYYSSSGGSVNADNLRTESNDHMATTDFRLGTQLYLCIPVGKGFSLSPGLMYNIGFTSLNDLQTIHPADLVFNLGVSYTFKKKIKNMSSTPADAPAGK